MSAVRRDRMGIANGHCGSMVVRLHWPRWTFSGRNAENDITLAKNFECVQLHRKNLPFLLIGTWHSTSPL